jgi:hypothetical protein
MNRWSIYIDVEGFSEIYRLRQGRAIQALAELMEALFLIASKKFPTAPERLFIHQFGDGFVVVSDFMEPNPHRPIAICLAVMRRLIGKGVATKAAISGGDFADISSWYAETVLAASRDRRHVNIGEGVMTIIPVMGMALIAPYKLASRHSGAVLLLDSTIFVSLPVGIIAKPGSPTVIDWVHSDFPLVAEVAKAAELVTLDASATEAWLRSYIDDNRSTLGVDWISATLDSVDMVVAKERQS